MNEKQRIWYYRTRNTEFLWKLGLVIVLAGFILAWAADGLANLTGWRDSKEGTQAELSMLLYHQISGTNAPVTQIWAALGKLAEDDFEAFLHTLNDVHEMPPGYTPPATSRQGGGSSDDAGASAELRAAREQARPRLASIVPAQHRDLALLLWDALGEPKNEPAGPAGMALQAQASEVPPKRFVNLALGVYYQHRGELLKNLQALEREGRTHPDARSTREYAVALAAHQGFEEDLARLIADPAFADVVTARDRLHLAASQGQWGRVFWIVPAAIYADMDWPSVFLAVFSGAVWLTILLRAGQISRVLSTRTAIGVVAVLLGVLSVWPTLWAIYWQEKTWGLVNDPTDLLQQVKYFTAGVGLREELSKLLLFLPLVPILLRRGDGLEVFMAASCVGLGFAIEENINYFSGSFSAVTVSRFLTANFLHAALTGILGLAFCRMFTARDPLAGLGDFLGHFTMVVVIHALYDILLTTVYSDYSIFAFTLYIYLAHQYFRQLDELREHQRHLAVSFSSIFIGGLALIFSFTLLVLSFQIGAAAASTIMYFGALGQVVLIIMFMRQFKEVGRT